MSASKVSVDEMRKVLLEVVNAAKSHELHTLAILPKALEKLPGVRGNTELEQALLTVWYDLFRTGLLSWGVNISNPEPKNGFHITERGRSTLARLSRDPSNPEGYLQSLPKDLNAISRSYVTEALKAYNSDCYRASTVMIGCAAESVVLELRDELVARMNVLKQTVPGGLSDWRLKPVTEGLTDLIESKKSLMNRDLKEAWESYWRPWTGNLRTTRNDAGHPTSIDPVTTETAHSVLLIFPELARFAYELKTWISKDYQ